MGIEKGPNTQHDNRVHDGIDESRELESRADYFLWDLWSIGAVMCPVYNASRDGLCLIGCLLYNRCHRCILCGCLEMGIFLVTVSGVT